MGNSARTPNKPLIQTTLKYAINISDLTAMQVSVMAKVPWVRFSAACQGKRLLAPEELERVAAVLECHPVDLLGETNIT